MLLSGSPRRGVPSSESSCDRPEPRTDLAGFDLGSNAAEVREILMRNPFRKKSTLEKTVETVEDSPRVLKSGLAAVGIFAGIVLVSAIVSRARSEQEESA
jgi:hypothetical protein